MFGRRSADQAPSDKPLDTPAPTRSLIGMLSKGLTGKDAGLPPQSVLATLKLGERLMETGEDAVAQVVSVHHTGMMINFNPVVVLSLKALTATGERFETTGQSIVSHIAVPEAGDTIRIKYNPKDRTQLVVV